MCIHPSRVWIAPFFCTSSAPSRSADWIALCRTSRNRSALGICVNEQSFGGTAAFGRYRYTAHRDAPFSTKSFSPASSPAPAAGSHPMTAQDRTEGGESGRYESAKTGAEADMLVGAGKR